MNRERLEAEIRKALTARDQGRARHLFRADTHTLLDNQFTDAILDAADAYRAAAEPASGRRRAAG